MSAEQAELLNKRPTAGQSAAMHQHCVFPFHKQGKPGV